MSASSILALFMLGIQQQTTPSFHVVYQLESSCVPSRDWLDSKMSSLKIILFIDTETLTRLASIAITL